MDLEKEMIAGKKEITDLKSAKKEPEAKASRRQQSLGESKNTSRTPISKPSGKTPRNE